MHFALPPRKGAASPPYARAAARISATRRTKQFQFAGYCLLGLLTIWLVLRYTLLSESSPLGLLDEDVDPSIVIVTVLDDDPDIMSPEYVRKIRANRDDYASRHGYTNFYANVSTYKTTYSPAPKSWALIPALRHALTLHPQATHLFSLTPHAFITNFSLSLTDQILNPQRLASLMIRDVPVVPPDSVIHTFSHLTPSQTNLILTQDVDNLAHTSLFLRNDEWSHYLLDAWFDPLYRSYNFQKAELHALEHIVQWHPTILAKLVLVPQRTMNSYNIKFESTENPVVLKDDGLYQDGDLLVVLKGCADTEERDCEKEMQPYWDTWSRKIKT